MDIKYPTCQNIKKALSCTRGFLHLGIIAVIGLVILVAGIAGYFIFKDYFIKTPSQNNSASKVYSLKGELVLKEGTVEKLVNKQWNPVEKGLTIIEGTTLRTGSNSKAVVELDDGSSVRFDQNSQATFTTLSDSVITVTQQGGRVYHRVNPGQLVYKVKSLNAVATAMGTSFSIDTATASAKTNLVVIESKVSLETDGQDTEKKIVESGQEATIDKTNQVKVNSVSKTTLDQEFYKWNDSLVVKDGKVEVKKSPVPTTNPTQKPTPKPTPKPTVANDFVLTAQAVEGGIQLTWKYSGTVTKGFKVTKSKDANPTYPARSGDEAEYIDSSLRSYKWNWNLEQGTTYHFRVGLYNPEGDPKITKYSNDVAVVATSSSGDLSFTGSIILNSVVSNEPGVATVTWAISGDESPYGFKVCKSANINPTYPPRDGDACELMGLDKRTLNWDGLAAGTYHFRVGVYNGKGSILVYTEDKSVTISAPSPTPTSTPE